MKKLLLALAAFGFITSVSAQTVPAPTGVAAMVCANNTVVPSPISGQFFFVQCDSSGRLITNGSGFSLLAKSGTSASITGTVTETPLATIAIPANLLGANGQIRINAYWTITNSGNNKTLRVRMGGGGITGQVEFAGTMTTVTPIWSNTLIANSNAVNTQFSVSEAPRGVDGLIVVGFNGATTVDMTAAQSLVITAQLVNVGETITLNGFSVEYAP